MRTGLRQCKWPCVTFAETGLLNSWRHSQKPIECWRERTTDVQRTVLGNSRMARSWSSVLVASTEGEP